MEERIHEPRNQKQQNEYFEKARDYSVHQDASSIVTTIRSSCVSTANDRMSPPFCANNAFLKTGSTCCSMLLVTFRAPNFVSCFKAKHCIAPLDNVTLGLTCRLRQTCSRYCVNCISVILHMSESENRWNGTIVPMRATNSGRRAPVFCTRFRKTF